MGVSPPLIYCCDLCWPKNSLPFLPYALQEPRTETTEDFKESSSAIPAAAIPPQPHPSCSATCSTPLKIGEEGAVSSLPREVEQRQSEPL